MKRRIATSLTLLTFILIPLVTYGALGGLVPCEGPECQACHIVELAQRIINFFIAIIGPIAALALAWSGFKMMSSQGNAGEISAAKERMTNIAVGIVIVLSAWLIVDTIMKILVKEDSGMGPWNTIQCVSQRIPTPSATPTTGTPGTGAPVTSTGRTAQCAPGNTACSVDALKNAGFTDTQAKIMSCIAMTESSGDPSKPPFNQTNPGSKSTACGTFQILGSTWKDYAPRSGSCSSFSSCTNATCNMQVTQTIVSKNGYRDWTCPGCNKYAQGCIDKYGGG